MTLLQRWTAFNLVGVAGIAVQLGAVALLVHAFGWHYLAATALAVELAVLHNFAWHQRWTWKDRQPASGRDTIARLLRFHALNGAVSLAGNLAVTAALSGALQIDPIVANGIAIAVCATINFIASERAVFQATVAAAHKGPPYAAPEGPPDAATAMPADGSRTRYAPRATAAFVVVALLPGTAIAGPGAAAASAWRTYESQVDARLAAASSPFFVHDRTGVTGWRSAVMNGGISMTKIDAPSAPDAKIHHWAGAIFVRGVTLDQLLATLKEGAGHESRYYEDVLASRLLSREGDRVNVFMKLRRASIVTVTYNTEHEVRYQRLTPARAIARSVATRIAELDEAGTANEHEKAAADDSGFLWRLNAYWRYEEVPGGVIVECESVSLSRAVPLLVRPVANPIVDRIARESLVRTLESLRTALSSAAARSARTRS